MSGEDIKVYPETATAEATACEPEEILMTISSKNRGSSASAPRSPAEKAAVATSTLRERTARRVKRTAELRATTGLTLAEIGAVIAKEEGEAEPFARGTVKDWWRLARRDAGGS